MAAKGFALNSFSDIILFNSTFSTYRHPTNQTNQHKRQNSPEKPDQLENIDRPIQLRGTWRVFSLCRRLFVPRNRACLARKSFRQQGARHLVFVGICPKDNGLSSLLSGRCYFWLTFVEIIYVNIQLILFFIKTNKCTINITTVYITALSFYIKYTPLYVLYKKILLWL
jgi:hypothetical protein